MTSPQDSARTPAEWITFGIASSILLAVAGLVVYSWVTERDRPPVLTIQQAGEIREAEGQFYVPFEISNTGGETVESVQVSAELTANGQLQEGGDQRIDFLSGGETEEGAFIFRRDPRRGTLRLRVASYTLP